MDEFEILLLIIAVLAVFAYFFVTNQNPLDLLNKATSAAKPQFSKPPNAFAAIGIEHFQYLKSYKTSCS